MGTNAPKTRRWDLWLFPIGLGLVIIALVAHSAAGGLIPDRLIFWIGLIVIMGSGVATTIRQLRR
jgi:hypothetical protein